jgi:glycosyltransferase involved in cell wall biosynthesis
VRVAVVTWDWPALAEGGVGTLSRVMARGLHAAGAEVEVWTRGGGRRKRALAEAPERFPVLGFGGRSWRRRGAEHWRRGLTPALERFQPDRVVVSSWDVLAGIEDLLPDALVVAHGRDITATMSPVREEQRDRILAAGRRWLCLTGWMEGELVARGVAPERVHRVPAAVDETPPPPPREPTRPVIALCVGRLIPRKGQDVAIEAVARLGGRVHLQLVGEGPDRARLAGLAGPSVHLLGRLAPGPMEAAWRGADLFVMPARQEEDGDTEGYGLVFVEAGARGLPVIGGRSAGAAEAIEPGVTGLLVDDPRDVEQVAAALSELAGDPELRARLGRQGRVRYERSGRPIHLGRALLELA